MECEACPTVNPLGKADRYSAILNSVICSIGAGNIFPLFFLGLEGETRVSSCVLSTPSITVVPVWEFAIVFLCNSSSSPIHCLSLDEESFQWYIFFHSWSLDRLLCSNYGSKLR